MKIDSFPIRIVSGIKGAAVGVKLITEDELHFLTGIVVGWDGVVLFIGVEVDKTPVAVHGWDLARGVDAADIEATKVRERMLGKEGNQGITSTAEG
jgi:hypothetical protein